MGSLLLRCVGVCLVAGCVGVVLSGCGDSYASLEAPVAEVNMSVAVAAPSAEVEPVAPVTSTRTRDRSRDGLGVSTQKYDPSFIFTHAHPDPAPVVLASDPTGVPAPSVVFSPEPISASRFLLSEPEPEPEPVEIRAPIEVNACAEAQTVTPANTEPADVLPLTGEPTNTPRSAPVVVVKIDNTTAKSRPQTGLAEADIVFEALIEGTATRFIAVYHSEHPRIVGPIRSARSTDFCLLTDLSTPAFSFSGANPGVIKEIADAETSGLLINVGALREWSQYWRIDGRRIPYNLYSDTASLAERGAANPVASLFTYQSAQHECRRIVTDSAYSLTPGRINVEPGEANGTPTISVTQSGRTITHRWNPELRGWQRFHAGEPHNTLRAQADPDTREPVGGAQLIAPINLIVIFAEYDTSPADSNSPRARSFGAGDALIATGDQTHVGMWMRTPTVHGWQFTDRDGCEIGLLPGQTWVVIGNSSAGWSRTRIEVSSQRLSGLSE